jgi:hypothetical protein
MRVHGSLKDPVLLPGGCENMDRIIKITLGILIIVLVTFVTVVGYTGFVEHAYRSSLSSTYTYTCTITTDSPLSNVTLFIPVPADRTGNSPVIAQISAHEIAGVPDSWKTELYDTGKSTLVKITTPSVVPPAGTSRNNPFTVTLYTNTTSKRVIDTENPVGNSPMFRPVQDLETMACRDIGTAGPGARCYTYLTALFADYRAGPNAIVTITSSLTGRNGWTIFEPKENKYRTGIYVLMSGNQKGWSMAAGELEEGIGAYDAPGVSA